MIDTSYTPKNSEDRKVYSAREKYKLCGEIYKKEMIENLDKETSYLCNLVSKYQIDRKHNTTTDQFGIMYFKE